MNAEQKYQQWCHDAYFDEQTKAELTGIANDADEIEERFGKELEFGTGGLRGIMGSGTNRVNIYTIRKATQGLANYIIKAGGCDRGVVIAYDSRNHSREFAMETTLCLAANGVKAMIFSSLRPTPMLSFALRLTGAIAGVVITASHNPKEYNGYKVYWEDGAQIAYPKDQEIIAEVNAISGYHEVKTISEKKAYSLGLFQVLSDEIDIKYMEELETLLLSLEAIRRQAANIKIVYTPLHGSGNIPVREILKRLGFEQVFIVKEQELPDGNFPTVDSPNPENAAAFHMAIQLARNVEADIILATDPDADRLGMYAWDDETKEYVSFTGNMTAMILLEFEMVRKKESDCLPDNGAVVTTIVSGKMAKEITANYNVNLFETLTGFKYIGEKIKEFKESGRFEFLFGYEESYGLLIGTHARDKDAIVAVMKLCEAAAYYKDQGITLCAQMKKLFETYGYYQEQLGTITLKGQCGAKIIEAIMETIRSNIPSNIGGYRVDRFRDYQSGFIKTMETGEIKKTGLISSNVLYFDLEGDAWCCFRPSGTEPKIKYYIGVKGKTASDASIQLAYLTQAVKEIIAKGRGRNEF